MAYIIIPRLSQLPEPEPGVKVVGSVKKSLVGGGMSHSDLKLLSCL